MGDSEKRKILEVLGQDAEEMFQAKEAGETGTVWNM